MRSRGSVASQAVVVVAVLMISGCGIAPIQREPGPPRTHRYIDAHARPRAFGGGVCPLTGAHNHYYPPVPPTAFVDDNGAWRETRKLQPFDGPHAWKRGRCTQSSWHQHVADEPATADAPSPTP